MLDKKLARSAYRKQQQEHFNTVFQIKGFQSIMVANAVIDSLLTSCAQQIYSNIIDKQIPDHTQNYLMSCLNSFMIAQFQKLDQINNFAQIDIENIIQSKNDSLQPYSIQIVTPEKQQQNEDNNYIIFNNKKISLKNKLFTNYIGKNIIEQIEGQVVNKYYNLPKSTYIQSLIYPIENENDQENKNDKDEEKYQRNKKMIQEQMEQDNIKRILERENQDKLHSQIRIKNQQKILFNKKYTYDYDGSIIKNNIQLQNDLSNYQLKQKSSYLYYYSYEFDQIQQKVDQPKNRLNISYDDNKVKKIDPKKREDYFEFQVQQVKNFGALQVIQKQQDQPEDEIIEFQNQKTIIPYINLTEGVKITEYQEDQEISAYPVQKNNSQLKMRKEDFIKYVEFVQIQNKLKQYYPNIDKEQKIKTEQKLEKINKYQLQLIGQFQKINQEKYQSSLPKNYNLIEHNSSINTEQNLPKHHNYSQQITKLPQIINSSFINENQTLNEEISNDCNQDSMLHQNKRYTNRQRRVLSVQSNCEQKSINVINKKAFNHYLLN